MEVRTGTDIEPFQAKDKSIIKEIFHPKSSNVKNQSLAKAEIRAEERTRKHSHKSSEEIYFILKGEGVVHVEKEFSKVEKGDAVSIPPGHSHWVENTSSQGKLVLLCFSSPPYGKDDTILAKRKSKE